MKYLVVEIPDFTPQDWQISLCLSPPFLSLSPPPPDFYVLYEQTGVYFDTGVFTEPSIFIGPVLISLAIWLWHLYIPVGGRCTSDWTHSWDIPSFCV